MENKKEELSGSEWASSSEVGQQVNLIPRGGCVFCKTQLNPSTTIISCVTGKQFTLSSNEIPINDATTTKILYIQFANANHRSCKNDKRNNLLYDHFCCPCYEVSDCKVKIIFHIKADDTDTKDVLLAKAECFMQVISALYPFGLNDNVYSSNINPKTYTLNNLTLQIRLSFHMHSLVKTQWWP